ncbi:MAG TPA: nickel pincer cofactor biosynthesis protein LarB [Syntrophorhabdaceae bacterium]|nr:nickel pincer cofactor biosynthesis protein LarB [Syntrophorhabdaceae bacterium]HPU29651.1 nickel pincer cofactor biosynthesis protein LarB [Syntrophorhabdaceae bacterium]
MLEKGIKDLLEKIRTGSVSPEEAYHRLIKIPFEDLIHTKIDHHRSIRKGLQEVVFGKGKTLEELIEITEALRRQHQDVLITRISKRIGSALCKKFEKGIFNDKAGCFYIKEDNAITGKGLILIVSAGTSDSKVAEEAYVTSTFFGNKTERLYDVGIAGIHRLLSNMDKIKSARVIIAVAGMEGALPSVIAGLVGVPVLAVPTSVGYGASLGGLTALFAMLNSCSTISVFNIDNGFGAAYFATLINRL